MSAAEVDADSVTDENAIVIEEDDEIDRPEEVPEGPARLASSQGQVDLQTGMQEARVVPVADEAGSTAGTEPHPLAPRAKMDVQQTLDKK